MFDHVRSWPATDGLAVVAPVVEPPTYVKPAGRVSTSDVNVTAPAFGLVAVIVYPSVPPAATEPASAVLSSESGSRPSGENVMRDDTVVDPPVGTLRSQLRPAPLSSS